MPSFYLPSKASGSQPERLINFSKQLAQYDLEGYVSQYTGFTHRIRFKAQTDKPTAQLSSKDITGAGLFIESKDVDLIQQ